MDLKVLMGSLARANGASVVVFRQCFLSASAPQRFIEETSTVTLGLTTNL